MSQSKAPAFDEQFSYLNQFILELVDLYQAEKLNSWDELDVKVKAFFTPERMNEMEILVPGWKKMASFSEGITLTHVMCVFLGVFMLPEFQALTPVEQQIAKWFVLFHDLDKFHIRGKKDSMHAFNSAVKTASLLPRFGFAVTEQYAELIHAWSDFTGQAYIAQAGDTAPKPDNGKLPEILTGIDQMCGENTPAALITRVVLFHISLNIDPEYPTPAQLTPLEIKHYITPSLFRLLKIMMLGDNEGWTLFNAETRKRQNKYAIAVFQEIERLIADNQYP